MSSTAIFSINTCTEFQTLVAENCKDLDETVNVTSIMQQSIDGQSRCEVASVEICRSLRGVSERHDLCYNTTHAYAECALEDAFPFCESKKTDMLSVCPLLFPDDVKSDWQEDYLRLALAFIIIFVLFCMDYSFDRGFCWMFRKCTKGSAPSVGWPDDQDDDDDDSDDQNDTTRKKKKSAFENPSDDHSTKSTDSVPDSPTLDNQDSQDLNVNDNGGSPPNQPRMKENKVKAGNKQASSQAETKGMTKNTKSIADIRGKRDSIEAWYKNYSSSKSLSLDSSGNNSDNNSYTASLKDFADDDEESDDVEGGKNKKRWCESNASPESEVSMIEDASCPDKQLQSMETVLDIEVASTLIKKPPTLNKRCRSLDGDVGENSYSSSYDYEIPLGHSASSSRLIEQQDGFEIDPSSTATSTRNEQQQNRQSPMKRRVSFAGQVLDV